MERRSSAQQGDVGLQSLGEGRGGIILFSTETAHNKGLGQGDLGSDGLLYNARISYPLFLSSKVAPMNKQREHGSHVPSAIG
jgi:hypothetical protein